MVLFLSDLHLDPLIPDEYRQKALINFLSEIKDVKKIFLVGDTFDFWFEYGFIHPGYLNVIEVFKKLISNKIEINLIRGNHDQWVGKTLSDIGINIYDQQVNFWCNGFKIHIAHGDFLDKSLTNVFGQKVFKSRICNKFFSFIPSELGFPLACRIAQRNRDFKIKPSLLLAFENYAKIKICEGANVVVLGHLHVPILKSINNGVYMNPGDWIENLTYLLLKKNEIFLKNFLDENLRSCKII